MPHNLRALGAAALLAAGLAGEAGAQRRFGAAATQAQPRNDLEGSVVEFKVMERRGEKRTVLSGRFRIKQSAVFDVPGSVTETGEDAAAAATGPLAEPKQLGVLDRIAERNRGGDRIGDVTVEKSSTSTGATPKANFRFDVDDEHPLSGVAVAKLDTRGGGGVWRGSYTDQEDKRWTFELRKLED